jgi:hypothetical protein
VEGGRERIRTATWLLVRRPCRPCNAPPREALEPHRCSCRAANGARAIDTADLRVNGRQRHNRNPNASTFGHSGHGRAGCGLEPIANDRTPTVSSIRVESPAQGLSTFVPSATSHLTASASDCWTTPLINIDSNRGASLVNDIIPTHQNYRL